MKVRKLTEGIHTFVISSKEDFRGLPLWKDALKFNDHCTEIENKNHWKNNECRIVHIWDSSPKTQSFYLPKQHQIIQHFMVHNHIGNFLDIFMTSRTRVILWSFSKVFSYVKILCTISFFLNVIQIQCNSRISSHFFFFFASFHMQITYTHFVEL